MIHELDLDGVPLLFTERPGPVGTGLVFRVGTADEPLPLRGITHLVEHLALHRSTLTDYHANGATGASYTYFHMDGSDGDAVDFLAEVSGALGRLPVERLAMEKGILRTEDAGRGRGAQDELRQWRYGARGFGAASYPELGIGHVTEETVLGWTRSWFTRGNAVAWLAGERVPRGLRLRLPDGPRRPVPNPVSVLDQTPAFFASGNGKVVLDAVVRRGVAASMFAGILQRELFRSLRQEGGYCYTADCDYESLGNDTAQITAFADALPEQQDAVLGGFLDVLAKLRVGRIEDHDIEAVRTQAHKQLTRPNLAAARLLDHGVNLLSGYPNRSPERTLAELQAVTKADLHRVAAEVLGTALLQVPRGRRADWAGFAAAPTHSATTVTGKRFRSLSDPDVGVVVGPEGVSLVSASGPATVRYRDCAAALRWPDGARQLIGFDGVGVRIEPTLHDLGASTLAEVDAAVHPAAVVPMPQRTAVQIPRPEPKPAAAKPKRSRSARAAFVTWGVLTALIGGFALMATVGMAMDSTATTEDWIAAASLWVAACFPGRPFVRLLRARR